MLLLDQLILFISININMRYVLPREDDNLISIQTENNDDDVYIEIDSSDDDNLSATYSESNNFNSNANDVEMDHIHLMNLIHL